MNKKLIPLFLLFSIFAGCTGQTADRNGNQSNFKVRDYNGDVSKGFDYWTNAHCHECHGTDMNQGLSPIDIRDLKKTNLDNLVSYIAETMPKAYGTEKCDLECAKHTAQFMMGWIDGSARVETEAGEVGATLSCSEETPVKRPQLIRLSPAEFSNSVKDLLQLKSSPNVAALSADERGDGFLYSEQVTIEFSEAYAEFAEQAANDFVAHYEEVSGCSLNENYSTDDKNCAENFIIKLAERAYKIPLSSELNESLSTAFNDDLSSSDLNTAIKASVEVILQSPFFLYRPAGPIASSASGDRADQYLNASRLSYLLTGTLPDERLWNEAKNGELTRARLLDHAERLLQSDQALDHLTKEFLGRWFQVKNPSPTRTDMSIADRQSLANDALAFIRHTAWGEQGGLVNLMTHQARGNSENKNVIEDSDRFGILTQPAWMVNYGLEKRTNPIMRGVFFAENLLCRTVPEFNGDVEFPDPQKGLSLRDRLEEHRTNPACASCHALFDPMGLAFEKFDQYGNTRTIDEGNIIDTSGVFLTDGEKHIFSDLPELMDFVANSEELRYCAMKNWMAFAFRNEVHSQLSCSEKQLASSLALDSGIEKMILNMLNETAFFK